MLLCRGALGCLWLRAGEGRLLSCANHTRSSGLCRRLDQKEAAFVSLVQEAGGRLAFWTRMGLVPTLVRVSGASEEIPLSTEGQALVVCLSQARPDTWSSPPGLEPWSRPRQAGTYSRI